METEHLSCTNANTVSKWIEMRLHLTHITEEFHRVRLKWFMSLWYIRRKLCSYLASRLTLSPNTPNQASTWASSPGVPSCVSKMISEPMVHLVKIVLLSCTDTNTVSKRTKMRFHMTLVTDEFCQVCLKQFSSLWYVWCEPCTYPASGLALSPNGMKDLFTWASSPRSTIGCVQNFFWVYGIFGANRAPILHQYLHCLKTDWNKIPHNQRHQEVLSGASNMTFEHMAHSEQTVHLSCVKISTITKQIESSLQLSLIT
jgi:hypothetical protein